MAESKDTEITLGTGRLLGLFFGLVAICGLFLGLGYMLGKSAAKAEEPPRTAEAATPAPDTRQGKAAQQVKSDANKDTSADLSFYKAVEQKEASVPLSTKSDSKPPHEKDNSPEMKTSSGSGYIVQVAAVTKQEDADSLVQALRKKQYSVLVAANPSVDKYYRVQIGPFSDAKEAEAVKAKLVADGYSPIVKR